MIAFRRRIRTTMCLGLLLATTGLPGLAQQSPDEVPGWSIGAGVISAPRPYVGADAEVIPVPLVQYEGPRFFVRGLIVGYKLLASEDLAFDVHLMPRFDGFENDDSPFLAGMDEPDPTIDLGLGMEASVGALDLGLALEADVLGRSEGLTARASLSRTYVWRRGTVVFRPEVGAAWQSEDLVDYYYGVDPDEALPLRPAYDGPSGTLVNVDVFASVRVSERWRLIGLASWSQLPDAITDSPIVDDASTLFGLVGLTCQL